MSEKEEGCDDVTLAAIYLLPTMGQPLADAFMHVSPDAHSWHEGYVLLSCPSSSEETEVQEDRGTF